MIRDLLKEGVKLNDEYMLTLLVHLDQIKGGLCDEHQDIQREESCHLMERQNSTKEFYKKNPGEETEGRRKE